MHNGLYLFMKLTVIWHKKHPTYRTKVLLIGELEIFYMPIIANNDFDCSQYAQLWYQHEFSW